MTDTAPARKRGRPSEKQQLSPLDWFNAATEAILDGGFEHVRVLPLAKRLKVTRGSFYWHFDDYANFIQQFLDHWKQQRIKGLGYWKPAADSNLTPQQELQRVVTLMLEGPAIEYSRMKVEFAIRDLAQRDAYARQIVADVDQARIQQTTDLLSHVVPADQARAMALIQYASIMGAQLLFKGQLNEQDSISLIKQQWLALLIEPPLS